MARTPDHDKRRALARRAIDILQQEGLSISTARLAELLEIKRPTLLYHFPTRGHIAELALEDLLSEQTAAILPEVLKHDHPLDQLFAQVSAIHCFHKGHEARLLFLAQAISTVGAKRMAEIIDVGNRVYEPYRQMLAQRIAEEVEAGTMVPCDPAALLALVRSVTDGLIVQRVMNGIDLGPVHELLWSRVLEPLKCTPEDSAT